MRDDGGFLGLQERASSLPVVRTLRSVDRAPARWRRPSGIAVGIVGIAVYNWWVVVAAQGRLLTSPDELFSDLEATGRPDATVLQHLDLAAGLIMIVAFLLRGPQGPAGRRREWPWMLAFAVSGAVGGQFSYACPEGLSASCRAAEWRLALPHHHYVHVFAGIAEFVTLTVAVYLAWQRTRARERLTTKVVRWTGRTLVVAYPLLGLAYLTDRMGAFVEPIFFVAFSAMVLVEVCEPDRAEQPHGRSAASLRSVAEHLRHGSGSVPPATGPDALRSRRADDARRHDGPGQMPDDVATGGDASSGGRRRTPCGRGS